MEVVFVQKCQPINSILQKTNKEVKLGILVSLRQYRINWLDPQAQNESEHLLL